MRKTKIPLPASLQKNEKFSSFLDFVLKKMVSLHLIIKIEL
jgi:hypothetical protein